MKLGVSTWCFRNEPVHRSLERISSLGVRYVELFANAFHLDPRLGKADVQLLLSCLRAGNLTPLSLHMPFGGVQAKHSEAAALKAWLGLVEDCLPVVEALKIPAVVIHPQFLTIEHAGSPMTVSTVGTVLEQVLPRTRELGVRVLLENLPSFMFSGYWESGHFLELFEKLNRSEVGMCFDISHCICSGLDLFEEIRRCLPWVREIHVSDNRQRSGADLHLPVQQGSTDWGSFIAFLREEAFDGNLILEIDGGRDAPGVIGGSVGMIRDFLSQGSVLP